MEIDNVHVVQDVVKLYFCVLSLFPMIYLLTWFGPEEVGAVDVVGIVLRVSIVFTNVID